jgi:hypothetical protein
LKKFLEALDRRIWFCSTPAVAGAIGHAQLTRRCTPVARLRSRGSMANRHAPASFTMR